MLVYDICFLTYSLCITGSKFISGLWVRNRDRDIENRLMDAAGEGRVG